MIQLFKMAFRNLGRNRRRSFFSALAVGLGLALLVLMASFIEGEMNSAIDTTIKLQTGHLQVRLSNYSEAKTSLKWADLIENPAAIVAQIESVPQVKLATPRLYASGIVAVGDETAGVRIMGIDPASKVNVPFQDGLIKGQFITAPLEPNACFNSGKLSSKEISS